EVLDTDPVGIGYHREGGGAGGPVYHPLAGMSSEAELHPIARIHNDLTYGPWRGGRLPAQLKPILAIDAHDQSHVVRRATAPKSLGKKQGTAIPLLYLTSASLYHFLLGGQPNVGPFKRPLEPFRPYAVLLPRGRCFRQKPLLPGSIALGKRTPRASDTCEREKDGERCKEANAEGHRDTVPLETPSLPEAEARER